MKFITKLKTAFGNTKTESALSNSDTLDAIMAAIEHEPFAISESNVLYAGLNELGGYYSFQTIICGTFQVKTKKGGHLSIKSKDFTLELDSESVEFESDRTDVKGRHITKIDFQIEEKDAAKINPENIDEMVLKCKAYDIHFNTCKKK
ncbi:MAG: hypothetical protein ACJA1H_000440 [Glaciecola sp.]|jgi:hypothetical protein